MGVMIMARTATAIVIAAVLLLLVSGTTAATTVYWTPAHELAPAGDIIRPAVCDLDRDGDYDVSVLGKCGSTPHYWNVGSPVRPSWQLDLTQFPGILACDMRGGDFGDLDDDGDQDLVIGCYYGDLHMYWNAGTPEIPVWQEDPSAFEGLWIGCFPGMRLADMDADGDLDIMVTIESSVLSELYYVENVGSRTDPQFVYRGPVSGVSFASITNPSVALGDIDGDGDLDLVGCSDNPRIQCWENVGTPQSFQFVESPSMLVGVERVTPCPWGLDLADFDGDGDPDLLIAGWDSNYLYLNEQISSVERTSWGAIKALYR